VLWIGNGCKFCWRRRKEGREGRGGGRLEAREGRRGGRLEAREGRGGGRLEAREGRGGGRLEREREERERGREREREETEEEEETEDWFLLQDSKDVVKTDAGEMRVVRSLGGRIVDRPMHIGFITMEPKSLFIPQYLDSSLILFIRRGTI
jgi:hypothetical protein